MTNDYQTVMSHNLFYRPKYPSVKYIFQHSVLTSSSYKSISQTMFMLLVEINSAEHV